MLLLVNYWYEYIQSKDWMKDIHSTRNFEREMAEMQKTLRSEAKRRHADPSTSPWEVGSIMERSHAVWFEPNRGPARRKVKGCTGHRIRGDCFCHCTTPRWGSWG